jgi:hypothetical protein
MPENTPDWDATLQRWLDAPTSEPEVVESVEECVPPHTAWGEARNDLGRYGLALGVWLLALIAAVLAPFALQWGLFIVWPPGHLLTLQDGLPGHLLALLEGVAIGLQMLRSLAPVLGVGSTLLVMVCLFVGDWRSAVTFWGLNVVYQLLLIGIGLVFLP